MAQTSWANVALALRRLRSTGLLDPRRLAAAPVSQIRMQVRPAGLYRQKPKRLKGFCRHLLRVSGGDLQRYLGRNFELVRRDLLSLDGIGPETADSILLYAGAFPTFVVDAYTVRVGRRLGWFDEEGYAEVKAFFESRVPPDVTVYREFHALFVAHGKEVCRPRPNCEVCPLSDGCAYYRANRRVARRSLKYA